VQHERVFVEDFLQSYKEHFDLIILYNVINHLAEDAVPLLPHDSTATELHVEKLRMLCQALNPGGWLVMTDCARSNFWTTFGLRSPFDRGIEWHKHQNPDVWEALAKKAGFKRYDLRWSYLYPLKRITANYLCNFLTISHFVMRLRAGTSSFPGGGDFAGI